MSSPPRVLVVGGGLAGLMTTVKAVEAGARVELFSLVPVKRSHSVCAQGGINGAVNTKGEGDTPWEHFDDTVYGGDFLANQPPVKGMCEAAPGIIYLLDRMGVPFNRTPEGLIDFRRFGGTKHHRTAFAGATTGQQLMYALDEQVRRHEVAGWVQKHENWDCVRPALDEDGRAAGIVAQELAGLELRAFPCDALVYATGGIGLIFGRSTNSVINTGSAASAAYQAGAVYANPEFIQVHPTAIPGADKLRLMSESARGEGGRVWVPSDGGEGRPPRGQPWYFLEDWYPEYGNLVPRDVATRAIHRVCVELGLGLGGQNMVHLDLTHLPAAELDRKLGGILEIYEKFAGQDPRRVPMRVFPAMHYTMGGLWVDGGDMSNVPGLFVAGEANFQYHGANRLGANSLLSCLYDGFVAGPNAAAWAAGHAGTHPAVRRRSLEAALRREQERWDAILGMDGPENVYALHEEMGRWMSEQVTVVRYNDKLKQTVERLREIEARWHRAGLRDRSRWANQEAVFTRHLWNMLQYAHAIAAGALARDESRGAHYKPEFPRRDDERWLRTTLARWSPDGPRLDYEPVDTSLIPPRERRYDVAKTGAAPQGPRPRETARGDATVRG